MAQVETGTSGIEARRLARLTAAVETRLSDLLPRAAEGSRVPQAMRAALLSPGKRLRPLLTLLTAWRLGADEHAALDAACAVEMVHAASLIFDDLPCMDDAAERRGLPATHIAYGEEIATLAAIGLLNQAYAVIAQAEGVSAIAKVEMIRVLTTAVGVDGLVAGQERDLQSGGSGPSVDEVDALNHQKTGALFLAAVRLGALVAGAEAGETDALSRFATELGMAFQAADDLTDAENGEEDAGRSNLLTLLGRDGVRREAMRRLNAARSALDDGGANLASLRPYVDVLLEVA